MSIIAVAMAKPKVVDLAEYKSVNIDVTINDVILALMQESVQSGGTLKSAKVTDTNLELRKALSANRHILLGMRDPSGVKTTIPTVIMKRGDTAVQASASSLFYLQGAIIDMKCILLYSYDEDDENFAIYVQANGTPVQ